MGKKIILIACLAIAACGRSAEQKEAERKRLLGAQVLVAKSDDADAYLEQFAAKADSLIQSGNCTKGDFIESGGWTRSQNSQGKYFVYCQNLTVRFYFTPK